MHGRGGFDEPLRTVAGVEPWPATLYICVCVCVRTRTYVGINVFAKKTYVAHWTRLDCVCANFNALRLLAWRPVCDVYTHHLVLLFVVGMFLLSQLCACFRKLFDVDFCLCVCECYDLCMSVFLFVPRVLLCFVLLYIKALFR